MMKLSVLVASICLFTSILFLSCRTTSSADNDIINPINGHGNWRSEDAMVPVTEAFKTDAVQMYENVRYAGQSASQVCDIYLPEGKNLFPVIVLVHGGGFAFQNQKMKVIEPVAEYAVSHGMQ